MAATRISDGHAIPMGNGLDIFNPPIPGIIPHLADDFITVVMLG